MKLADEPIDAGYRGTMYRGVRVVSDGSKKHFKMKMKAIDILIDHFGFHADDITTEWELPLDHSGVLDTVASSKKRGRVAIECAFSNPVRHDSKTNACENAPKLDIELFYLRPNGKLYKWVRNGMHLLEVRPVHYKADDGAGE